MVVEAPAHHPPPAEASDGNRHRYTNNCRLGSPTTTGTSGTAALALLLQAAVLVMNHVTVVVAALLNSTFYAAGVSIDVIIISIRLRQQQRLL